MSEFIITDAAKQHLQGLLAKDPLKKAFRVSIKPSGCSGYGYALEAVEAAQEGDLNVESDGLTVYLDTNPQFSGFLRGLTIDLIVKDLNQKQLVFRNSKEGSRCGCGKSFSMNKDAAANP